MLSYEIRRQAGSFEKREDKRVKYCYVKIHTHTPIRTLPDLISGEVRDTYWIGEEVYRFDTLEERKAFMDAFNPDTHKCKQLTKRGMNDVEKITGKTIAVSAKYVKPKQVIGKPVNV